MMKNNFIPPETGKIADNTNKVLRPALIKSIIAILLLIVAILTYVLLPNDFKNVQYTDESTPKPVLLEGEQAAGTTAIRMFDLISADQLQSIEVNNKNGANYAIVRASDGGFCFKGRESVVYGAESLTFLISATGNTVTSERVYPDLYTGEGGRTIPYDNYGLGDNYNGRYTIETTDGKKHTVRIGNMAPSGTGYYACVEGREAVYIMAPDIGETVLGTAESVVTPNLGIQGVVDETQASTAIDHVTIWHSGKHIATINSVGKEEVNYLNAINNFAMSCNQDITPEMLLSCPSLKELDKVIGFDAIPYDYIPDDMTYNDIASNLPSLTGEETVALKDESTGNITDEQLKKFGIIKDGKEHPAYEIFYSYTGTDGKISYNHIILSEKTADDYYYAYSNLNSIIVKIPADTLYYLPFGYDRLVETAYFQDFITSYKEISVKSDDIDYTFNLSHTVTSDGTGAMLVTESDNRIDAQNFRNFYRVLLSRKLRGAYKGEKPEEDKLFLTVTLKDMNDKETVYKYYRASTQQAYMTINGKGEFYCLNSDILKIERDAVKLINGEQVNNEDWY